MTEAKLVAVCRSPQRLTRKQNIGEGKLVEDWGLEGDAHAGKWHRQISLLAEESIQKARTRWGLDVSYGDFAENLTTCGINLLSLSIGARLQIGPEVILEITQKGKKCHTGCEILKITGKCIFPLEGIFGRVLRSGIIRAGDLISVLPEKVEGFLPVGPQLRTL
ncbi:MAG TPA: MOSC domain-containing protein [candidate division Zixibacteria bacterium]|nr:MOSC domain-containing protein [candidate division Zixibacteria bacterium]